MMNIKEIYKKSVRAFCRIWHRHRAVYSLLLILIAASALALGPQFLSGTGDTACPAAADEASIAEEPPGGPEEAVQKSPDQDMPAETEAASGAPEQAAGGAAAEEETETVETAPAELSFEPSLTRLNLAHFYTAADDGTPARSWAKEVFDRLCDRDISWISSLYEFPEYEKLCVERIEVFAYDGDGRRIEPYSNAKEIMSMANAYTYYKGVDNTVLFLSYCLDLWEASHSGAVSAGEVYYCTENGLQYPELAGSWTEEETEDGAGDETDGRADDSGEPDPDALLASPSEAALPEKAAAAAQDAAADTSDGGSKVLSAGEESADEAVAGPASDTSAAGAEDTAVSAVQESENNPEDANAGALSETGSDPDGSDTGALPESEIDPGDSDAGALPETEDIPDDDSAQDISPYAAGRQHDPDQCPGHVDLRIKLTILGLSGSENLYSADEYGSAEKNFEKGGWTGWNTPLKTQVSMLCDADWAEDYGLASVSLVPGRPLSFAEIASYVERLPEGLSMERRRFVLTALQSVGRIPYYYGGRASYPYYEGNNFGTGVEPDAEGRILKGLDCSGWISWLYWSVTGERLPYDSTAGLSGCGRQITAEELEPGDILIRHGENAHVIMFLGWTEDGRIECVHESSTELCNVMVSTRRADIWDDLVRLIE